MGVGCGLWRVCVTGGSGYVASYLIKKLLLNGHTVHATVRNLNDESKVGLLKSLPNADTNLVLFEADIYEPHQFEAAIKGCHFVFHVATPLLHTPGSQYKNRTEASVAAGRKIAEACRESTTVRRLIYTASVVSASPMKDDGSGFKHFLDETCWTPLNLSFPFSNTTFQEYTDSKTKTEKELLGFGESSESGELEVVSLACGLISGETLNSHVVSETTVMTFSQFTDQTPAFNALRFIEELDAKVPLVHIDDVWNNLLSMADSCVQPPTCVLLILLLTTVVTILNCNKKHGRECNDYVPIRNVKMKLGKLVEIRGFIYKYDGDMILEAAFHCYKNNNMFDVTAILPPT